MLRTGILSYISTLIILFLIALAPANPITKNIFRTANCFFMKNLNTLFFDVLKLLSQTRLITSK